jgi:hypothetical protein
MQRIYLKDYFSHKYEYYIIKLIKEKIHLLIVLTLLLIETSSLAFIQ